MTHLHNKAIRWILLLTLLFGYIIHYNCHKFHNSKFITGICILAIWFQDLDPQVQNHIVVTTTFKNMVQSSAHANSADRVIHQLLYYAVSLSLALEVNTLCNVLSVYVEAITVRFMKVGAS